MKEVKRGEVYYANLSPIVGSEQDGRRPVVILQNDIGNAHSPTTIVAAITGELGKANLPTHVIFTQDGMERKSMILLEQIRTVDKSRLCNFVCKLDGEIMEQIDRAIFVSLGLKCPEVLRYE